MQAVAADTPQVEQDIQKCLVDEFHERKLGIRAENPLNAVPPVPPLTVNDARRIIACLRENPTRFNTFEIFRYPLRDADVLNVLCDGLLSCTFITRVILYENQLGNEGLEQLLPAFYNTSVKDLDLYNNGIQGQRGGELVKDLLVGNQTLLDLDLWNNPIGCQGAVAVAQGLAVNNRLRKLVLNYCNLGNAGLANLVLSMGGETCNNSHLLELRLASNNFQGGEGVGHISSLLRRCPALAWLDLGYNNLGPLGARALSPVLVPPATSSQLVSLYIQCCYLGNDGIASLIPDGHVNRTLKYLHIHGNNDIQGLVGGENVVALASRCTNLETIYVEENTLSPDQQRRLDLLLDRKHLCTAAKALAGSPFPVLFQFLEQEAHRHEHRLSAIFVILQNDGDDHFCNAHNRATKKLGAGQGLADNNNTSTRLQKLSLEEWLLHWLFANI